MMERLVGQHIDLLLTDYHHMLFRRYDSYFFEMVLHDTLIPVGYVELRVGHSQYLYYLGNVGYQVEQGYRGHHFALEGCQLLMPFAKKLGMDYVLFTCSPENVASMKTIEALPVSFLEQAEVPKHHDLCRSHETVKRIYRYEL